MKNTDVDAILNNIPEDRHLIARRLLEELEFMYRLLKTLKAAIQKEGALDVAKSGNQIVLKESPAVRSYNTTIQRYGNLYKQLELMLPKDKAPTGENALKAWLEATK